MKLLLILFAFFPLLAFSAENIGLDKWSLPAGAWARGEELSISSGNKTHGELMWAPFVPVGKNKVWKLKVTLVGKGEIQASLGCYTTAKKHFVTRYPFADGTKKINTAVPIVEFWYLTLPEGKTPVDHIRPAIRIVSGSFSWEKECSGRLNGQAGSS